MTDRPSEPVFNSFATDTSAEQMLQRAFASLVLLPFLEDYRPQSLELERWEEARWAGWHVWARFLQPPFDEWPAETHQASDEALHEHLWPKTRRSEEHN